MAYINERLIDATKFQSYGVQGMARPVGRFGAGGLGGDPTPGVSQFRASLAAARSAVERGDSTTAEFRLREARYFLSTIPDSVNYEDELRFVEDIVSGGVAPGEWRTEAQRAQTARDVTAEKKRGETVWWDTFKTELPKEVGTSLIGIPWGKIALGAAALGTALVVGPSLIGGRR